MADVVDEFEFFLDKEWSDGLPVVTPTEERVQRLLTGTRRDPAEDFLPFVNPDLSNFHPICTTGSRRLRVAS